MIPGGSSTRELTVADQGAALRAWLHRRRPDDGVTYSETHVSILAFGRERVWKLKKAVKYPFVDLSTADKRRAQCEREIKLNRRFAPDVYLDVVPLDDESGRVLDHLLEMRRMPDDRRLAALAVSGADATACLDEVAGAIARFHSTAPSGGAIDAAATRDAVADLWEHNLTELAAFAGSIIDAAELDRVATRARTYLAGRAPLFTERIAAGRARDGHGDLLADDIFCLPDGVRVLDCLEFDDRLRYGDGLADAAFLAMDLERIGRVDLARRFLDRYAAAAGDEWPASLEHFFIAYRALVRAKVACLRAREEAGDADAVSTAAGAACRLVAIARDHLGAGRVRLVLIGGPPATGKTTLADAVGRVLTWPVLHSDEVRKELAGLTPTAHRPSALDSGIYDHEWDERTYRMLCDRARTELERGNSVIIDASWSDAEWRAHAVAVASATSSELTAFVCRAPAATLAARATARAAAGTDASDAAGAIAEALAQRFAPWPEANAVDTTPLPGVVAAAVLGVLSASSAQ